MFRQGFPLSLLTWSIFHLSVYYLATESNSADTKHTTAHPPALSFIYNVQVCTYVFVKFRWKFENLNHREDDLQLHTLHFTRHLNFFENFPCSRQQANNNKRLWKEFLWSTRRAQKFPANSHFCVRIFFYIPRCHEKELIAVFKLPTWNACALLLESLLIVWRFYFFFLTLLSISPIKPFQDPFFVLTPKNPSADCLIWYVKWSVFASSFSRSMKYPSYASCPSSCLFLKTNGSSCDV